MGDLLSARYQMPKLELQSRYHSLPLDEECIDLKWKSGMIESNEVIKNNEMRTKTVANEK